MAIDEMLQKKYFACMKEMDDEKKELQNATLELEKVIGKKALSREMMVK